MVEIYFLRLVDEWSQEEPSTAFRIKGLNGSTHVTIPTLTIPRPRFPKNHREHRFALSEFVVGAVLPKKDQTGILKGSPPQPIDSGIVL